MPPQASPGMSAEERIHAMRKIKGSSGFARLYGAKDAEQFARQAQYMDDFTDDYPKDIAFSDSMPTYADMSLAQLRCFFTWRTRTQAGDWRSIGYSYVLLRVFELLNLHGDPHQTAEQLAELWLNMQAFHPKLNLRMPQWFKDYYICHDFSQPFDALAASLGLSEFFPERVQTNGLLSLSSYACRESRFFREQPQLLPVLECALTAAVEQLSPLFTLHGVNREEAFFMKPARFSYHELYRDALALPPPMRGTHEIHISHSEIYRIQNGNWSCAMESAFRPPSHALGYVVKRLETALRQMAGFHTPWSDPEADALSERWQLGNPAAFPLLEDPRLPQIINEIAQAAYHTGGTASPTAAALQHELEQEPLRSILSLRKIKGGPSTRFAKQGAHLAALSDDYPEQAHYDSNPPAYDNMSPAQLRTYLTWRAKLRAGKAERTDAAYALLHARELEQSIGTDDPLEGLCRFLRDYAPLDKAVARRLQQQITEYAAKHPALDLAEALAKHGVQAWFPTLFLFAPCDQLPVFDQLSSYHITRSKFYQPAQQSLFSACFAQVLPAVQQTFQQANLDFRKAMQGADAPAWAAFLLKRMEQRMRQLVDYPYAITANPAQMLRNALQGRKRVRAFLASGALSAAIDAAVDTFAQTHDLSPLAAKKKPQPKSSAPVLPAPPPALPPVTVDFSLLPQIRAQAQQVTQRLIVEDPPLDEAPAAAPIAPLAAPAKPRPEAPPLMASSLYEALSPQQIAVVEYLCDHRGAPPPMDEIEIAAINELALEFLGDTLIEASEDGPHIIEDYRDTWNAGAA